MSLIAWRDSWRAILVALALASIAGCGGGGGGDAPLASGATSPPPSSPPPSSPPPSATGSATISWTAPLQNTDGSALTDLAGYEIRFGQNAGALDQSVTISTAGLTVYVIDNLAGGTWYFAVSARNSQGVMSSPSEVASKVIS